MQNYKEYSVKMKSRFTKGDFTLGGISALR